jgi:hypothetical protein
MVIFIKCCHGLRHSCLMGNCASPSVRCNYPSYTSVVYSQFTATHVYLLLVATHNTTFNSSCIRAVHTPEQMPISRRV